MGRILPTLLWTILLFSTRCRAQVEQYIKFDATLDYDYVSSGSAGLFLGDDEMIATYKALTRATFKAGIKSLPDLNPILLSPPRIHSLKVVDAFERSSDPTSLVVTFRTVFRVVSSSGLSDANLADDINLISYWISDPLLIVQYATALREEIPSIFENISGIQVKFGIIQRRRFKVPTTAVPAASIPSPTNAPVIPTMAPVIPTEAPVPQPTLGPVASLTSAGIEQFLAVNGTLLLTGVVPESEEIFWGDLDRVVAYEETTRQHFQTGIDDSPLDTNPILNGPPQILSLKLVDFRTPATDAVSLTFEATLRVNADTILTEQEIFDSIRFGPYWYVREDQGLQYIMDVQAIFPEMFQQQGSFQIGFGPAVIAENPETSDESDRLETESGTVTTITGNPSPSPVGSEPTTGGIEQFIVVNATMNFDGAAADSAITFWSDPEAVTAFESLTKQVFEAGIADPNSNHNTILNKDPELLAVNVVKVINPSTDSIVITFQTTMRLFSDIVLDDQNFLVNLKFGPYWYANPDLTFAYVSSVDIIYPTLFAEEEVYLQIEFGVAESIQDPTPLPGPSASPSTAVSPFGIERFIIVNGTMSLEGAAPDSATTFWSDPVAVMAFESVTKQAFEAGIADPNSNHNTILNKDPEILAVKAVKVINPSEASIDITFQTTMRLFSDIVLEDRHFLVNVKFTPYWYANPEITYSYVSSVGIIYPTLFAEEEVYLQIDFGTAVSIPDPGPITASPTSRSTSSPTSSPSPAPSVALITERPSVSFPDDISWTRPPVVPDASTSGGDLAVSEDELSSGTVFSLRAVTSHLLLSALGGVALLLAF